MTPSFVTHPSMAGERWAADVYALALEVQAKYVQTPLQRKLFKACIDTHNQDWSYWLNQQGVVSESLPTAESAWAKYKEFSKSV